MNISGKNWSRRTILVASLSALCAAFVGCGGTDLQGGGSGETSTDATSMWQEGRRLTFGLNGSKVDSKRGVELLQKAADAGSLDAQADLATAYMAGGSESMTPTIAQDRKKACELALKPAEAGNPLAQIVIINAFPEDVGGEEKHNELREKYSKTVVGALEKRAESDPRAKMFLAMCWASPGAIESEQEPDREKALRYIREVADSGSAEACMMMAEGMYGVTEEETLKYFQKAVDADVAFALVGLARCYGEGIMGFEQDFEKAVALLRRAAEQGSVQAKIWLAECYAGGMGVWIDKQKAFEFYLDAAKSEYAAEYERGDAMMKVGECYEKGVGVEASKYEARKWYRKAAAAGARDADDALERLDAPATDAPAYAPAPDAAVE